jgi:CubicO group peptidase (beta-lactamase class C family)
MAFLARGYQLASANMPHAIVVIALTVFAMLFALRNRALIRRKEGSLIKMVSVGLVCLAATTFAGSIRAESQSLDEFIQDKMKANNAPGLAACIVKKDRLAWRRGFGWADIENKVPMTDQTIQNIGSISKTITATAVMQLWEQGKFKLDDDVNKYLPFRVRNPHFPDDPITFRQLLTHRSSIKDGPAYDASYACGDPVISLKDWIRAYLMPGGQYYSEEDNFHTWKPVTVEIPKGPRAYSNVAFGLLGYLVEVISGGDVSQYCQKNILTPLGMKGTGWYLADVNIANHAIPYTYIPQDFKLAEGRTFETLLPRYPIDRQPVKAGELFAHCLYSFPNYPDGLIRTSVQDLSRFLRAYINDGAYENNKILKNETIQTMLSEEHFGRGLCWGKMKLKSGDVAWGHGGADPGISTQMLFRPKDGVGVILFFNCDRPGKAVEEIQERLLEEAAKF